MLLSPCPPSQPRKPFTALVLLRCEQPAVVFRFPLNKQVGILTSSLEDTPLLCKPTRGGSLPALLAACLEKKKQFSARGLILLLLLSGSNSASASFRGHRVGPEMRRQHLHRFEWAVSYQRGRDVCGLRAVWALHVAASV